MPPSNEQRPEDRLSVRRLRVEMWLTRVGILVTLGAFAGFGVEYLRVVATHRAPSELAQAAVFLLVVSFLVYGGLVYLTSRLGWLRRKLEFRHAGAAELHAFCSGTPASLAILIPSYKEEAHVVRHTLLSAALQAVRPPEERRGLRPGRLAPDPARRRQARDNREAPRRLQRADGAADRLVRRPRPAPALRR